MTQVVETLPHVRQRPTEFTESISWLLMTWRCKDPGHRQPQQTDPLHRQPHQTDLVKPGLHGPHILTHWGRVTHICVGNLTIIGSDNGLSPGRRQAIIWTSAGILLIGPLGTNFIEILIKVLTFSFKENVFESVVCEMASILSWPQCVKSKGEFWSVSRDMTATCPPSGCSFRVWKGLTVAACCCARIFEETVKQSMSHGQSANPHGNSSEPCGTPWFIAP